MKNRILIIGAGASGLMAGIQAAAMGASVTILESNDKPGKKLLASGNGKCNLTNLYLGREEIRSDEKKKAFQILEQFPVEKTLAFFHKLGIETIDKNGWVYPITDQSSSVLRVLLLEAEYLHIKIKTKETVRQIRRGKEGFLVKTDSWEYSADRVIISCGSPASAVQGSSGDAADFAGKLGIDCKAFLPALVPLRLKGNAFGKWAGIRFRGSVKLLVDGKEILSDTGILQTTDFGISGIPVFQVSRYAVQAVHEQKKAELWIDFVPAMSRTELAENLQEKSRHCPYKSMRQLLSGLLPEKLIPFLLTKEQKASRENIEQLTGILKEYRTTVKDAAGLKFAQVCSGGICLSELTDHLESRKIRNLFFTGEALDVDGMCGGYNLQWAWASGYVAGRAAASE